MRRIGMACVGLQEFNKNAVQPLYEFQKMKAMEILRGIINLPRKNLNLHYKDVLLSMLSI